MQGSTLARTLLVDGSPEPVRAMRATIDSFLRDHGLKQEEVRAIVLAFSEGLDNAWEHGTQGDGEIDVRLRHTARYVLVSLQDRGTELLPVGRIHASDEESENERGRGMLLMNKLMDFVHVRGVPGGGTRVSMLRLLGREP